MSKKRGFRDKSKMVTFEVVHRSVDDPLYSDPNASRLVLDPIAVGSAVTPEQVAELARLMSSDATPSPPQPSTTRGIGAEYNRYFVDLPDDGTDYSQFFSAIDEGGDDGVFISPDGTVHDLTTRSIPNVDLLVGHNGLPAELFGTEIDPTLPKLVDDTNANLLAAGVDPEVLLVMDESDPDALDDDFFARALELEKQPLLPEGDARELELPRSQRSTAPSHSSHISHRSQAMDMIEEKVEHLLNTAYNDGEEDEGEEEDGSEVDWDDVISDFRQFHGSAIDAGLMPGPDDHDDVGDDVEGAEEDKDEEKEDEDEEEEEEDEKPKEKWDCESQLETLSTTDNLPTVVRDRREGPPPERKAKKGKAVIVVEERPVVEAPEFVGRPGETREDAKARKKQVKEYQRQKRQAKKETKAKFASATKRVKKSIAGSAGVRGQRVMPLD
jgi:protein LTV1